MDPQQRLLLECSAEALAASPSFAPIPQQQQKADGKSGAGSVGAYVGVASSDYGSVVKDHTQVRPSSIVESNHRKETEQIMGPNASTIFRASYGELLSEEIVLSLAS